MTIEELIERLEKAEGPDRWLDARIDAMFRIGSAKMQGDGTGYDWAWENFPVWAHHKQARGRCGVQHDNGDLGLIWDSMAFTASLDAAVALAEKVLPGWNWTACNLNTSRENKPWADVASLEYLTLEGHDHEYAEGFAATPALALCLAILKAKHGEQRP